MRNTLKKTPQQPFSSRLLRGAGYGLIATSIWGLWLALTRRGVNTTLTAADITAIRFFVSGFILLPVVLRRGIAVGQFGWKGGVLLTFCVGAPYTLIVATALRHSEAAHATLAYGTKPIFIAFFTWLIFKEPIALQRVIGFIVSISGLIILTTQVGETHTEFSYYSLYFLVGALAWATFTMATKAWKVDALHATAIVAVLSCVGYVPYYVLNGHLDHLMNVPPTDILLQAIVQGVLTAIIALWAYGKAIAYLGASRAGFFPILAPVVGTLIAVPLLNETPSLNQIIGMTVVCIGFLLGLNLQIKKIYRYF